MSQHKENIGSLAVQMLVDVVNDYERSTHMILIKIEWRFASFILLACLELFAVVFNMSFLTVVI